MCHNRNIQVGRDGSKQDPSPGLSYTHTDAHSKQDPSPAGGSKQDPSPGPTLPPFDELDFDIADAGRIWLKDRARASPAAAASVGAGAQAAQVSATFSTPGALFKPRPSLWTPRGTHAEASGRALADLSQVAGSEADTIGSPQYNGSQNAANSGRAPASPESHDRVVLQVHRTLQAPPPRLPDAGADAPTRLPSAQDRGMPKIETAVSTSSGAMAALVSGHLVGYSSPGVRISV